MKTNKQIIEALRDNADLAWAAYGFFDRGEYDNGELGYRYENETEQNKDKMPQHKITYPDILTDEYKDLRAYNNISDSNGKYQPIKPFYKKSKFQGDMNKEQARQLLSDDKSINQIRKAKYTLVHHIPNTLSGFSATIFYNHTTKTYTLAIRGTEPLNRGDIGADTKLALGNIPKKQHLDMLLFYNQCIGNILFYVERDSKEYIESRKGSINEKVFTHSFIL